jgi:AcrR family transcriptional regulator
LAAPVALAPDVRRAQILGCARRLFAERNYAAVSTEDIAREVGVRRGLLHHYFGTKRDLYLEVLRSMVLVPPQPAPEDLDGRDPEAVLAEGVERWLEMVARNRGTWMATVGAQGFGRDPEVEAILDEARERAADSLVAAVHPGNPAEAPRQLRALFRAYSGLAEAASLEWLRGRLTREEVRELLVQALLRLVRDVLPHVERAGATTGDKRKRGRAA